MYSSISTEIISYQTELRRAYRQPGTLSGIGQKAIEDVGSVSTT